MATSIQVSPLAELAGTTTNSKDAARRVFTTVGYGSGGLLHRSAQLLHEPLNPVDPSAVAVHVEGERIGYLPSAVVKHWGLAYFDGRTVELQLWADAYKDQLWVRGYAWLGFGEPKWKYTAANSAPVTSVDQKAELAGMFAEAHRRNLAAGGVTAQATRAGTVRGKHYIAWIPEVERLKREKRHSEVLNLLHELITATEAAMDVDRMPPPPAYTEHAAIVYRKEKDYSREVAILERYCARWTLWETWERERVSRGGAAVRRENRLLGRLGKARELRDRAMRRRGKSGLG